MYPRRSKIQMTMKSLSGKTLLETEESSRSQALSHPKPKSEHKSPDDSKESSGKPHLKDSLPRHLIPKSTFRPFGLICSLSPRKVESFVHAMCHMAPIINAYKYRQVHAI